eukprot:2661328-Rhodomonas_salina.2
MQMRYPARARGAGVTLSLSSSSFLFPPPIFLPPSSFPLLPPPSLSSLHSPLPFNLLLTPPHSSSLLLTPLPSSSRNSAKRGTWTRA